MLITQVETLPRKKNRIWIDGEYAFMLYDRDMGIYGLEDGTALSDELYDRIMKETVIRRAHQKSLTMLERMDRTVEELRRKLKQDLYSDRVIDETVSYLSGLHYLDDSRYAESYIRSRIGSVSRRELMSKLYAKGIDRELFDQAYEACAEDYVPADHSSYDCTDSIASCQDSRSGSSFGSQYDDKSGSKSGGKSGSQSGSQSIVEADAAYKALSRKLGLKWSTEGEEHVITPKEKMSAIGYMLRKGFRRNDIMHAFDELGIVIASDEIPDLQKDF